MKASNLRRLTAAIVVALAPALAASPAQAGYIYDLTVAGTWSGTGSITFDSLSGSTPGDVSAFTFHVSSGTGAVQDYGLADLAAVTWSIESLFDLSLILTTSLVPFGTGQSGLLLVYDAPFQPDPCGITVGFPGSISCETYPLGSAEPKRAGLAHLTASLDTVTNVPEPGSLALFSLGLAGLGLAWHGRRARRC